MVVNTLDSPIFCKCEEVRTLGWDSDSKAREMLQKAAEFVQPIMAKRKWKVRLLTEFYPQMPNLLGLNHNHGQKIEIRLRSPRDRSSFLPYESILQTLLHELCHNNIGPHNAEFYKLLDEISKEAEQLARSGGFGMGGGAGKKLSNERRNPDLVDKRRMAAAAAEKRIQRSSLFKSGRLGGGEDMVHLVCDPREMAYNAAHRRMMDEKWCGSANHQPDSTERDKPSLSSRNDEQDNEVIVIDSDEEVEIVSEQTKQVDVVEISRNVAGRERRKPNEPQIPERNSYVALAAMRRFNQNQQRN